MNNSDLTKHIKERRFHGDIKPYEENLKQFDVDFERTFSYIGVFLYLNIIMEQHIDDILELHLAKNRRGFNGAAFKSLLLHGRFFNIYEKQKIFGDLTKSTFLFFNLVKKEEAKNIRKLINNTINHRNIIAHNRFGISVTSKNPIFKYYEGVKIKEHELTQKQMTNHLEDVNNVIKYLKHLKPIINRHESK